MMPIGTSLEDVIKIIETKEKWYVLRVGGWGPWPSQDTAYLKDTIDRKTIKLSLCDYGHPLYYVFFAVDVVLRFDDDLKLHEVKVRQYLNN